MRPHSVLPADKMAVAASSLSPADHAVPTGPEPALWNRRDVLTPTGHCAPFLLPPAEGKMTSASCPSPADHAVRTGPESALWKMRDVYNGPLRPLPDCRCRTCCLSKGRCSWSQWLRTTPQVRAQQINSGGPRVSRSKKGIWEFQGTRLCKGGCIMRPCGALLTRQRAHTLDSLPLIHKRLSGQRCRCPAPLSTPSSVAFAPTPCNPAPIQPLSKLVPQNPRPPSVACQSGLGAPSTQKEKKDSALRRKYPHPRYVEACITYPVLFVACLRASCRHHSGHAGQGLLRQVGSR